MTRLRGSRHAGARDALLRRRRDEDDPLVREVLELQRGAGNRAVSRLLAREPAADAPVFSPVDPRKVDITRLPAAHEAAFDAAATAAWSCIDGLLGQAKGGNPPLQSVPELVALVRSVPWKSDDGRSGIVADKLPLSEVEGMLRQRAKVLGVVVLDHRRMDDRQGVEAESKALLANLGIETTATFGGSSGQLTVDLTGELSGQAQLGPVKVEGSVERSEAKAELKAGSLFSLKGSVNLDEQRNVASWKAQLTFGTTEDIVTPAEVAQLMKEAKETFEKGAMALRQGGAKRLLDQHAGEMGKAVAEILEAGRRKKAQRGGWSAAAGVERKESGETVAGVTFTWSF